MCQHKSVPGTARQGWLPGMHRMSMQHQCCQQAASSSAHAHQSAAEHTPHTALQPPQYSRPASMSGCVQQAGPAVKPHAALQSLATSTLSPVTGVQLAGLCQCIPCTARIHAWMAARLSRPRQGLAPHSYPTLDLAPSPLTPAPPLHRPLVAHGTKSCHISIHHSGCCTSTKQC